MNVNGVTTPPVVYIPTQVIAPSVPNDRPIGLPTTDRKADPTPQGTPFVDADARSTAKEPPREKPSQPARTSFVDAGPRRSSMVPPPDAAPRAASAGPAAAVHAASAPAVAKPGAFDKYA